MPYGYLLNDLALLHTNYIQMAPHLLRHNSSPLYPIVGLCSLPPNAYVCY